jgi:NADH-quinone oxidoreductase subunit N
VFGATGTTVLTSIRDNLNQFQHIPGIVVVGIFFIVVGFAFKVSAVPFHFWAPDTYEGAPTPVTAFLSVASKAAGFTALLQLVFVGFLGQSAVWRPVFWVLAALTMTVGNLIALRQTNIVRMLAYSSVAQAGYILVPLAVADPHNTKALHSAQVSSIVYLLVYAAMNLGAFAVVIAVARKTRSGDITSYGGLLNYAPGLTVLMTIFLFSLAGIPPLGGWFAKLYVFRAALDAGTVGAVVLAIIAGVNSVIALFYYAGVAREMWMQPVPDGDTTPIRVPPALGASLIVSAVAVLVIGVYPNLIARLGDAASLVR